MQRNSRRIDLFSLGIVIAVAFTQSQETFALDDRGKEYAVTGSLEALRGDAGAVVRKEVSRFEVKDDRRARQIVTRAVTIFRKDKEKLATLVLWYDKFVRISKLEGRLFDANGKEIRSLKDEDMKDYSAVDGHSLYEETRVKVGSMYHDLYPYTVEFHFELSLDGFINWPSWFAQPSEEPVEYSRFEVVYPAAMELRCWTNRDSIKPQIKVSGSAREYVWEARNLPFRLKTDPEEELDRLTPIVRIAPQTFAVEDHAGDMTSWKTFGEWFSRLWSGKNNLPADAIQEVNRIMESSPDVHERVNALYRYLQSRTRYVNITLGIGGWQPFDATYVHQRGYGDCKALCNYMIALLEKAGIPAFPVLIRHGDPHNPIVADFPSNQFNHVIVSVPVGGDTTWLECTSESMSPGHIGADNENHDALMITPVGGVIVRTPSSSSDGNVQRRKAVVTLDQSGAAAANVTTIVEGDQQDEIRGALASASTIERERWLSNDLEIPNSEISRYEIDGIETPDARITTKLELKLPRFASVSSNRMFFPANLMNRETFVPPAIQKRLSSIRFRFAYRDVDTIVFRIPPGYVCEATPGAKTLNSSFSSFTSKTTCLGDTAVVFIREQVIRDPVLPADRYEEYRSFFSDVVRADKAQVVLKRKE